MKIQIDIQGTSPLMMHNERLANSEDPFTKQIKELTDKKTNKTDRDKAEISKLEWYGGIYANGSKELVMPSANVLKCLRDAAKATKEGQKVAAALTPMTLYVPFVYKGPKEIDAVFADPSFTDRRLVKVKSGRVLRTRPIFPQWGLSIQFTLLDTVMNYGNIERIAETAGQATGLCDARILGYGRFDAKVKKLS
jgi:hypothetical protein